jgi:hypothetical protein
VVAKVDEELMRREFSGFAPQGLANTISAMAVFKFKPSDEWLRSFLKACKAQAVAMRPGGKQSDTFILQEIATLVWSLSAFEALDRPDSDELFEALAPLTEALLAEAGKDKDAANFVHSLECALLGHEHSSPGLQKLCGAVERAWGAREVPPPPIQPRLSRLQQDVARVLEGGAWRCVRRCGWAGGLCRWTWSWGEKGEWPWTGPSIFFVKHANEPTGNTLLKRRRRLGVVVERGELKGFTWVEYQEWNQAQTDDDKAALLRRLLREAGLEL